MDALSFYVTDKTLRNNKFKVETVFDKDKPFDNYNSLRFDYYTRKINNLLSVSVNYTFKADKDNPNNYRLIRSVVQLHIKDTFAPIAVQSLSEIISLINLLTKNDRQNTL